MQFNEQDVVLDEEKNKPQSNAKINTRGRTFLINLNIPRYDKAFKLVEAGNVVLLKSGYSVVHNLEGTEMYHVNYNDQTCECNDHKFRQIKCCHIIASQIKAGTTPIVKDLVV